MRLLSAVLLLLAAVVVPGATAQAAPYSFLNLSFNMCGNKCNNGTLGVADATAAAILDRPTRPRTATLQEVCAGQAQRVRARLAAANYTVLHVPTAHKCDDGSDYGIALVYKGASSWHRVYPLPNPGGNEPRVVVCAMLQNPSALACSTHIDFHADGTRGAQIREVADLMAGFAQAGHAAYIGGDFNTEPTDDQMDVLYLPAYGGGATGKLTEAGGCCTRGGVGTGDGGRKIDYTFGLAGKMGPNWIDVVPVAQSDHHRVWSSFTLK